jgi:metallo-beta-lactamase class B
MELPRLLQTLGLSIMVLLASSCFDKSENEPETYVRSLEIVKLSENDYLHISFLKDNKGGFIPCKGYMRKEGNEVFIFDTPINNAMSEQLISYVYKNLDATIKGVLVSHAHIDAAGGLKAFVNKGIPSYGSSKTARLLARDTIRLSNTFDTKDSLKLGRNLIKMNYLGPAHTDDNIIAYLEGPNILLGGCMIKSLGASKGNLADANLKEWAKTVSKVKHLYPEVSQVIPGHGMRGDSTLLNYTISMFQIKEPDTRK